MFAFLAILAQFHEALWSSCPMLGEGSLTPSSMGPKVSDGLFEAFGQTYVAVRGPRRNKISPLTYPPFPSKLCPC
jgi:hypothetical protein